MSIPWTKKSEVIANYLYGDSQDVNARKNDVATGSVSNITKDFSEYVSDHGLDEAAEEYDVLEEIQELRETGRTLSKLGRPLKEINRLFVIVERIEKIVPIDRVEDFIRTAERLDDPALVDTAIRLVRLEEKKGLSCEAILRDAERKIADLKGQKEQIQERKEFIRSLNWEIKNLQDEVTDLREKNVNLYQEYDRTKEKVERSDAVLSTFKRYDIDLTQGEACTKIFKTVEQHGYDPYKLIQSIKTRRSLQEQIKESRKELHTITRKTKRMQPIKANAERMVTIFSYFVKLGWTIERFEDTYPYLRKLTEESEDPEEAVSLLKKKYEYLEPLAPTWEKLARIGFTEQHLESICNEVVKRGASLPNFMDAFYNFTQAEDLKSCLGHLTMRKKGLNRVISELSRKKERSLEYLQDLASDHKKMVNKYLNLSRDISRLKTQLKIAEHLEKLESGDPTTANDTSPEQITHLLKAIKQWCSLRIKMSVPALIYCDFTIKSVANAQIRAAPFPTNSLKR